MSGRQRPKGEDLSQGQLNSSSVLEKTGSGRLGKLLSQESAERSSLPHTNDDFEEEDDGFVFKRGSQPQAPKKAPGKRGRPPGSKNKPKALVEKQTSKRQKPSVTAPTTKRTKTSLLDELEEDPIEGSDEEDDKIFSLETIPKPKPKPKPKPRAKPKAAQPVEKPKRGRKPKAKPAVEEAPVVEQEEEIVEETVEPTKSVQPKKSALSQWLSQTRTKPVDSNTANTSKRRSSLSNRGKRLSSVGNGFVAEPHPEIPDEELYKHISQDLPDPHKMRQLLVWCAKRAAKETSKKKNSTAKNIANVIKDEIIRDLADGKISTSWWVADNDDSETDQRSNADLNKPIIVRPNRANQENLQTLETFEKKLEELNKEEDQWRELGRLALPVKIELPEKNDSQALVDGKLGEIADQLQVLETYQKQLDRLRLVRVLENIKLMVHKLKQSKNAVNELTEKKIREISAKMTQLIEHDDEGHKFSSVDLLKGFSELG
ncbi:hypothetical protein OGAPHI_005533 [Ogataea philodendri]|uniref:Kinetochore protein mis13 n=1 Tax=Ogataea philodendri TaxID=1378263 RepID=A0A9P8T1M5_9ASCO|nr:uncharacterized protein OGAPHI_005533 [Ogataea philodendri]KAH3662284.1 hypothetical protein OGAPHI_005533 [Ogataea philodendri]